MKTYSVKTIIKKGRFESYFLSLSNEEQKAIKERLPIYTQKYAQYCDKKNREFLINVFFVLASLDIFKSEGKNEDASVNELTNAMHNYLRKNLPLFKKAFVSPFIYSLLRIFIPKKMLGFNSHGWETIKSKKGKKDIYFEVHKCLVHEILKQENKVYIGAMFCNSDLVQYMELPCTEFKRTMTLIKGGKYCDMHFIRHKKNEKFNRYPSI